MNLQQLRYLVTTADEGTMTRAAEALHVAQPALSRAVRGLEREIGVTVFERKGRGIRVTRDGLEVIAGARRILAEVDRLGTIGGRQTLRVSTVSDQAHEVGSPTIAGFVTRDHGRAALAVEDTSAAVVEQVREGRSHLGIIDLPAPADLWVTSLGWQELVLLHPPGWTLDDPIGIEALAELPLLAHESDDWRHAALDGNLRRMGVQPRITTEVSEHELVTGLVLEGAGVSFSYGRQAATAATQGVGVVHLTPPAVREIGIVAASAPGPAARAFIDIARAETETMLLPIGDPLLERATWFSGGQVLGASAPPTSVRATD